MSPILIRTKRRARVRSTGGDSDIDTDEEGSELATAAKKPRYDLSSGVVSGVCLGGVCLMLRALTGRIRAGTRSAPGAGQPSKARNTLQGALNKVTNVYW